MIIMIIVVLQWWVTLSGGACGGGGGGGTSLLWLVPSLPPGRRWVNDGSWPGRLLLELSSSGGQPPWSGRRRQQQRQLAHPWLHVVLLSGIVDLPGCIWGAPTA